MLISNENIVRVGIAQMDIVSSPNSIRTSGLGSCVGVIIYDSSKKIAGLIHIMLPDSTLGKAGQINQSKFADTGIPALIASLKQAGASSFKMKAKLAGGAQMFQFSTTKDTMRIGPRNVEAVLLQLKKHSIPVVSQDTGGNSGRTIEFDPQTCLLNIRTVNQGVKDI
ncbi:chemotaxis protein CheD [Kurthia sibirica]|uniref:Probable chemoreceptor glutamine deamidase CheD n=1 Tax=Kurthia sibirica TaxID=202750 RepID=A0A2U3AQY2_9BACL|nr:chemotaxis protein CheD [Kurthia sibirica]PWI26919.1 chemotaxis protein CheD [Kurthia sibirica]GEK32539.1 chemoreceptor glutamine deamidase CheD [Kurthia sibirica]